MFEQTIDSLDNKHDVLFLTALLETFKLEENWRSMNRKNALTFHISHYMFWEICHCVTIYALYRGFQESFDEENIVRASSDIMAILISLFNSIQCSWINIKFIYCIFNQVSNNKIKSYCTQ